MSLNSPALTPYSGMDDPVMDNGLDGDGQLAGLDGGGVLDGPLDEEKRQEQEKIKLLTQDEKDKINAAEKKHVEYLQKQQQELQKHKKNAEKERLANEERVKKAAEEQKAANQHAINIAFKNHMPWCGSTPDTRLPSDFGTNIDPGDCEAKGSLGPDQICQVKCKDGLQPMGNDRYKCSSGGVLTPPTLKCVSGYKCIPKENDTKKQIEYKNGEYNEWKEKCNSSISWRDCYSNENNHRCVWSNNPQGWGEPVSDAYRCMPTTKENYEKDKQLSFKYKCDYPNSWGPINNQKSGCKERAKNGRCTWSNNPQGWGNPVAGGGGNFGNAVWDGFKCYSNHAGITNEKCAKKETQNNCLTDGDVSLGNTSYCKWANLM